MQYKSQVWTQCFPSVFKILLVIYIMKFKLHLLYFMRKELAPIMLRIGIVMLAIGNCIMIIGLPFIDCDINLSDAKVRKINVGTQSVYLLTLSIFSLIVCNQILKKFNTNTSFKEARFRLITLEVMVQLILVSRLFATIF